MEPQQSADRSFPITPQQYELFKKRPNHKLQVICTVLHLRLCYYVYLFLSVHLPACQPLCLPVCLPVTIPDCACFSICLSVCPSVCPCGVTKGFDKEQLGKGKRLVAKWACGRPAEVGTRKEPMVDALYVCVHIFVT